MDAKPDETQAANTTNEAAPEQDGEGKAVAGKPRKRRWFQFHLSTAVVGIMFLGGFIGANMVEYTATLAYGSGSYTFTIGGMTVRGYPFYYYCSDALIGKDKVPAISGIDGKPLICPPFSFLGILLDMAVAIGALSVISVFCESLFWYGEKKRGS